MYSRIHCICIYLSKWLQSFFFIFRGIVSSLCCADFYLKEGKCTRRYNLNNGVYSMYQTYYISSKMLVFHLKHVWMDITDLIAFICAPILTLVDGVWRGHVSVQKKTVTQKPDVEVVRNICSIWLFSFLSLTVVFITIIIFLFKKKLANKRGHNTRAIFLPKTSILKKNWFVDDW